MNIFKGELVRLSAEDPEAMGKAFSRWGSDMDYFRMLDSDPPRLWSEKSFKEWLEKDLEKNDPNSFFFSIRTLQEEKLIGFVGLFDLYWQHGDALVAIGIGEQDFRGKGYGTDAMRLLANYAFQEMNLRRLTLIVFEYNQRAIRSYEKVGFKVEGRVRGAMRRDGRRWDWLLMGLLHEEWMFGQSERYAILTGKLHRNG